MIVVMAFAPPADTAAPARAECYDKTAHCHRSTDPSHLLWSNGQQEPATFLRVSEIRVVLCVFPMAFDTSTRQRFRFQHSQRSHVDPGYRYHLWGSDRTAVGPLTTAAAQGGPRGVTGIQQWGIWDTYRHNRSWSTGVTG